MNEEKISEARIKKVNTGNVNNNTSISIINAELKRLKNRKSTRQLSDLKKVQEGFLVEDSVIDIGEQEYGFSNGEDILYTFGIETCCGVIVYDKEKRFLCHLDGSINYSEVLELIERIKFDAAQTSIIIVPGATCGLIEGCFDYKALQKLLIDKGFKVIIQRIPSTLGFISVEPEKITIGTIVDRSLDTTTLIKNKIIK